MAMIKWKEEINQIWNGRITLILSVIGIGLSTVSHLGNNATRICVARDWVVVLCKDDKAKLAG